MNDQETIADLRSRLTAYENARPDSPELREDLHWIESNSHDPQAMVSAPELANLAVNLRALIVREGEARKEAARREEQEIRILTACMVDHSHGWAIEMARADRLEAELAEARKDLSLQKEAGRQQWELTKGAEAELAALKAIADKKGPDCVERIIASVCFHVSGKDGCALCEDRLYAQTHYRSILSRLKDAVEEREMFRRQAVDHGKRREDAEAREKALREAARDVRSEFPKEHSAWTHFQAILDVRIQESDAALNPAAPSKEPVCPECVAEPYAHRLGCSRINSNAPFPAGCGEPAAPSQEKPK